MTKMMNRLALLTTVAPRAFNTGGWKKDADGKLVLDGEGNPIYVGPDGAERSVNAATITNLNSEAKGHRTAKEKAEADLAKYRDANGKLIDPEAAIKAIDTVSKIDAKTLIDAGKVDEVREQMRNEFTAQLGEKDKRIEELTGTNKGLLIDRAFDSSEFIRDRIAVPRDMFRDSFGRNVKVDDNGNYEFYGRDGNRLMSKKNIGEYAKGDEAFELMVEAHPQKDTIMKAQQSGGSGNNGGGGARGQGRVVKRADFDAMSPGDKANAAQAMQKGELTIAD